MKIDRVDVFPISVPYKRDEVSSQVNRSGITEIIVKITTDEGHVGWGEAPRLASANVILEAVKAMIPLLINQDPWQNNLLDRNLDKYSNWQWSQMTRNLAYGAIDMALWDIYGKDTNKPLYKLFGGNLRDEVDYFYYLSWDKLDNFAAQCEDGVSKGYNVFYMKAGRDEIEEERLIQKLREIIGPDRKIRLDVNMAWDMPKAKQIIKKWDNKYKIDFVEAPVNIQPLALMKELASSVETSLCVNEGLWQESEFLDIVNNRCGDYLCYSHYYVGTIRKFLTLANYANFMGWKICKHTHGELGLTAAIGQHLMLTIPNCCDGNQQTAQNMADDILTENIPIQTCNTWGLIEGPGLGVSVDEDKVNFYHKKFLKNGEYKLYGKKFPLIK